MESYLASAHYDLITPDGMISRILNRDETMMEAMVLIEAISPAFVGFAIDPSSVFFNTKSSLAQLGVDGKALGFDLDLIAHCAEVHVQLRSYGHLGKVVLQNLTEGCFIGKLFAADQRRRVRDPDYLLRMFQRTDRDHLPLLSLGTQGSKELELEKINGYTVAKLALRNGVLDYDNNTEDFIPTLTRALRIPNLKTRELLSLHQVWKEGAPRKVKEGEILLANTIPLHIRTVFGRVIDSMLPEGMHHTSANVLQPDTKASGDVFELYGKSKHEATHIPLEFYTLEPHREHIFFSDRDQLISSLEDPNALFKAFETAPKDPALRSAIFIVKGEQMLNLTTKDWIGRKVHAEQFPGLFDPQRQAQMVNEYIRQQPSYPFLKAIESGLITSQGVLFCRYFPSPLMKKMLLGDMVQSSLKGIYFLTPSQSQGEFFSHEDRSMLIDLDKFAIPVFWVDKTCGKVLRFTPKPDKDTGMFVPIPLVKQFIRATAFGVYGSTLINLQFEKELTEILEGILEMRTHVNHPLLSSDTPLTLITGGGPGLMEVGNRVARSLNILSCANIVDFSGAEQKTNAYIDAKMTYRLDRLVERQAEFNLDFPIFLMGGYGTDFEFALEGVRRKVSLNTPTPVLLLGDYDYWRDKITPTFQANLRSGTIRGVEWVSNCFYNVQTPTQALKIYKQYFSGTLPIGRHCPSSNDGFFRVS
ncbi:MAG: hypothetical protein JSS30_04275 [Verrucomicrobia bacterium]|nr:hypothetical protein [Verrucomicrobiota bacterium]